MVDVSFSARSLDLWCSQLLSDLLLVLLVTEVLGDNREMMPTYK